MVSSRALKFIISVAVSILFFSAFMDTLLWRVTGFLVPCWTIAALVVGYALLLIVVRVEMIK